jgi:predicted lipase
VEVRKQHPDYRVYLTGHSLGAGAAVLTALLLRAQSNLQSDITVTAFATPSCTSLELAQQCEKFVTTLVSAMLLFPLMCNDLLAMYANRWLSHIVQLSRLYSSMTLLQALSLKL